MLGQARAVGGGLGGLQVQVGAQLAEGEARAGTALHGAEGRSRGRGGAEGEVAAEARQAVRVGAGEGRVWAGGCQGGGADRAVGGGFHSGGLFCVCMCVCVCIAGVG